MKLLKDLINHIENKVRRLLYYMIPFLLVLSACNSKKTLDEKDYVKWLSKNMVKSKTVNKLSLSVKYLPPEYLAYKELKDQMYTNKQKDSLISIYRNSINLLLTINPKENAEGNAPDLMYYNISSIGEYNQRFVDLTFSIGDFIQLKTESKVLKPVLHVYENTYSISAGRTIYLVFADTDSMVNDLKSADYYELVFNDMIFNTGVNYFKFTKEEINNIPNLRFK